MLFLADESCDFAVVGALRAAGHDVLAICEVWPRAEDADILELAARERRLFLTEDKDSGQMVLAAGQGTQGVILLRFPATARNRMAREVSELVTQQGERLWGAFTVVQPGRIRIRRTPGR